MPAYVGLLNLTLVLFIFDDEPNAASVERPPLGEEVVVLDSVESEEEAFFVGQTVNNLEHRGERLSNTWEGTSPSTRKVAPWQRCVQEAVRRLKENRGA